MYRLKNKKYPDLYWSEVAVKWGDKEKASFFYSEDDAFHALQDVGSKDLTMLVCQLEKVDVNNINMSSVVRMGGEQIHCDPECPFLKSGKGIDAQCSLLNRHIPWYDWHIAICHDMIDE